ncbi:unnamed protein product [Bursaphelenchus xylophilus]|uniref:adenylate cyclase n=1 Tax=Bursaphelenchus xylophilus TaxID=6326 RepID=A0A1I7SSR7_BURXY|nr:unnamed protein product [Bursaphelenchus xylophilus]CAG9108906.1 unnamed protein product [Bursaphelenchus xylophilus]
MGRFGDPALEAVYQDYQLGQNVSLMVYALCIYTTTLILLALSHLFRTDWVLLLATTSASFALALNIILNIRSKKHHSSILKVIALWLCTTTGCTLISGGQNGLLPVIITCFTLYTIFCFHLAWTVFICVSLSLAQVVVFVLHPVLPFSISQLIATVIVHVCSNGIGIYLYTMRNRLSRAMFLNSRNVLMSHLEALKQQGVLETLLSAVCPKNQLQDGLKYLYENMGTMSTVNVTSYRQSGVLYAQFDGMEDLLSQISLQDSGRLIAEFEQRISIIAQKYDLIKVSSSNIVLVAIKTEDDSFPEGRICQAALDLHLMIRGFCEASSSEIKVKIGLASGSVSSAFLGASKWHLEVTGPAMDEALQLSRLSSMGTILVSSQMKPIVDQHYNLEQIELQKYIYWRLVSSKNGVSTQANLLFPNQRRMSLTTLPQAVNRLLNVCASQNTSNTENAITMNGRRKKKVVDSLNDQLILDDSESSKWMNMATMRFREKTIEKAYHFELDRWFIPALTICIILMILYGGYQCLVMPRLLVTIVMLTIAIAMTLSLLPLLYARDLEHFCHFVTQTFIGHYITIILVLVLMYVCVVVNIFSCPTDGHSSSTCHVVYYPVASILFWMLAASSFIRFGSIYLLSLLSVGIGIFCIHMFFTHAYLYTSFGAFMGWPIQTDIVLGLFTFSFLMYLQSRRNEKLIRIDFISHLKFMENMRRFDRVNELIKTQLNNQLPEHVANNYLNRTDPYCHLCQSVGILTVKFGEDSDWHGILGLQRLQELIRELDLLVESFTGLEKVRNNGSLYIVAVGVLPEAQNNVHDAPFTIGDLLASLTNFSFAVKEIATEENIKFSLGMDCGPALSVVIGGNRPHYEVIGAPKARSYKLMETAEKTFNRILVSEEIYLALRPRNFNLDDRNPIQIAPGLIGYGFVGDITTDVNIPSIRARVINSNNECKPHRDEGSSAESSDEDDHSGDRLIEEKTESTTLPTMPTQSMKENGQCHPLSFFAEHNRPTTTERKLEDFTSMNSSISSELYSIDMSVETDSDMEWITPEMMLYDKANQNRPPASPSQAYKGDCAKQYSDFSEIENFRGSASVYKKRKRRQKRLPLNRNGPKIPDWLSSKSSFASEVSLPHADYAPAIEKLDSTSKRVDRMLQELANINIQKHPNNQPFPTGLSNSMRSVNSKREMSSACHTEYDNADSETAFSDNEFMESRRSLNDSKTGRTSRLAAMARSLGRRKKPVDIENDADIDSNCSSLRGSTMFDGLRWKSVHSIGYENEYEFVSETDISNAGSKLSGISNQPAVRGAVGIDINCKAMDDDESEDDVIDQNTAKEVLQIAQDIRRNFGDFELSTFSDRET